MLSYLTIILPFIFALAIYFCKKNEALARKLVLIAAGTHALCVILLLFFNKNAKLVLTSTIENPTLLGYDTLSWIVLAITSTLFIFCTIHSIAWIPVAKKLDGGNGRSEPMPLNVFYCFMSALLGSMSLVILSQNLALTWVSIEATTLVSAPLICYNRTKASLEAMWKYLLICSVGISIALFGTMLLIHSIIGASHGDPILSLAYLKTANFNSGWFKAAFILALAGYGTKMGLAPFHTWLPDAYSESPAMVSALLSGALINCSFMAIYRFTELVPADIAPFCQNLMFAIGILSVAVAGIFIVKQCDFNRMLAYSSVEHMGLILILTAIILLGDDSKKDLLPVLFIHLFAHSLTKMTLFLTAGNILLAYGTRAITAVRGLYKTMPTTGKLWFLGLFLITACPPSLIFYPELYLVLNAPLFVACATLLFLFVVFAGMMNVGVRMANGVPGDIEDSITEPRKLPKGVIATPLMAMSFLFIVSILAFITMLFN
jgi:hydrogenase-4 component F